jgi:hypothetical protein
VAKQRRAVTSLVRIRGACHSAACRCAGVTGRIQMMVDTSICASITRIHVRHPQQHRDPSDHSGQGWLVDWSWRLWMTLWTACSHCTVDEVWMT